MQELIDGIDTRFVMATAKRPPIVMVEGRGSWLTDSAGRRYLDFVQGWAVNCLGHSPPLIAEVLSRQAARHGQGEVRGRGLLLALALRGRSGPALVEKARARGLLINAPREDALRFMPALNVTADEIEQGAQILRDTFQSP